MGEQSGLEQRPEFPAEPEIPTTFQTSSGVGITGVPPWSHGAKLAGPETGRKLCCPESGDSGPYDRRFQSRQAGDSSLNFTTEFLFDHFPF